MDLLVELTKLVLPFVGVMLSFAVAYGAEFFRQKSKSEVANRAINSVENIVQAIARDCLAESIKRLEAAGYQVVMHIHDEVVIEGNPEDLDNICAIMGQPIPWAPGLVLKADGFATDYYKKD